MKPFRLTIAFLAFLVLAICLVVGLMYSKWSSHLKERRLKDHIEGSELLWASEHKVRGLAVSKDGRWVAAGDVSGKVKIWSISTRREKTSFDTPSVGTIGADCIAFTPDGKILAVSYRTLRGDRRECKNVRFWDVENDKEFYKWTHEQGSGMPVEFDPTGKNLVVNGGYKIVAWDVGARKNAWEIDLNKKIPMSLSFSETGLLGARADELMVFQGTEHIKTVPTGWDQFIWLNDDRIVVSNYSGLELEIWDVMKEKKEAVLKSKRQYPPWSMAYCSKNDILLAARGWEKDPKEQKNIQVWSVAKRKVIALVQAHIIFEKGETEIYNMAWTPDGKYFFTVGNDGRVRMWDLEKVLELYKVEE